MNRRGIVYVVMGVVLAGLFSAAVVGSIIAEDPDSMFHEAPMGGSTLIDEANAQQLESYRLVAGAQALRAEPAGRPAETLFVITSPSEEYLPDEVDMITEFVRSGGQLLVADNFGQANTLTTPLGVTFERVRLASGSEGVTLRTSLEGHEFNVTAKSPTALHFGPDVEATTIAWSTSASYLDRDGDGLINAWEPTGPFPVVAEVAIGTQGGRLVAVADPSLLVITEDDSRANEVFRQDLLAHMLPQGGRIIIDESKVSSSDPVLGATALVVGVVTERPWGHVIAGATVFLLITGCLVVIHRSWGPHRFRLDRFIRRQEISSPSKQVDDPTSMAESSSAVRIHWTRRGLATVFGGIAAGIIGLSVGNLQATYVGALLMLAAVLSSWTRAPKVSAQRKSETTQVHEDSISRMDIVLRSYNRVADEVEVRDALPKEFEMVDGSNWFTAQLNPRKAVPYRYTFRTTLRGPYDAGPLQVRTKDPFGLRTVEVQACGPQSLLVLPRNDPLSRIPFKSRIPVMTMGPHLVNRAGDGTEFHALRDYQSGDSIRIVNWKASARSKELVVNQRVHESKATLTVFLDARAITQAGPVRTNPINEGCRIAMSIASGGLQARDNVRIIVYGDGVKELGPQNGRARIYELSKALASVEAGGDTKFRSAVEQVLPTLKGGSPAILVSGMEGDETVLDGLKTLRQRAIPVTVVAIQLGTDPGADGAPEPESRRIQEEHEATIAKIRGTDIPLVPTVPGMPLGTLFQVGLR